MNAKIHKLKIEHQKNDERIANLRNRNAELDKQITELENLEITDLVRSVGLSVDELAELIHDFQS